MKKSTSLFVCYFDRGLNMSLSVNAYLFKFGDDYKRFHDDILYFCNWADQPINRNDGWDIYNSLQ